MNAYDYDLQMFIEAPREPDPIMLKYLRWLVEHNVIADDVTGDDTFTISGSRPPSPMYSGHAS